MEFLLLRILKGRLFYRRGDLSLFIQEPNQDLMFDSIEIYESAYKNAYKDGNYIKDEIAEILMEKDLWSPFDDQELKDLKKEEENLKLQCFRNYIKTRELASLKFSLGINQAKQNKLLHKKHQFDEVTCEGIARATQWNWLIEHSTFYSDGTPYDWKKVRPSVVVRFYDESAISQTEFRSLARFDNWRSMWILSKKTGNLFDLPSTKLTKDQLTLCSFSNMYDNVYESSDCPDDKVIEDDVCLDGWFIDQRKKSEQYKKERAVESALSNPKISNAGEIFMFANSDEEIDNINSMNSAQSNAIKKQRLDLMNKKGAVYSDAEFEDVKTEFEMRTNSIFSNHMRGT